VIEELTNSKEKQQAQMKALRETIIANEQQIRDLKKKSADTQTQLRTKTTELATITEQVKQLREENQRYVDMAFQQRQDIIKYKKELLRLDPAMSSEPC
jgi:chromosome segregation ATPase